MEDDEDEDNEGIEEESVSTRVLKESNDCNRAANHCCSLPSPSPSASSPSSPSSPPSPQSSCSSSSTTSATASSAATTTAVAVVAVTEEFIDPPSPLRPPTDVGLGEEEDNEGLEREEDNEGIEREGGAKGNLRSFFCKTLNGEKWSVCECVCVCKCASVYVWVSK